MRACLVVLAMVAGLTGCLSPTTPPVIPAKVDGSCTAVTALAQANFIKQVTPYEAGAKAAQDLRVKLAGRRPAVVLMAECFRTKAEKEQVACGVRSVFGDTWVAGMAVYGIYTRDGALDRDAVGLLALAGEGVSVRQALVPAMEAAGLTLEPDPTALTAALDRAGKQLASQLPVQADTRLLVVLADAHSPKNQLLLDGLQTVYGKTLPVAGGSANKNAGQNWLLADGRLWTDAACALAIDGNLRVIQGGRQAQDNQAVLDTARAVSADLRQASRGTPVALLAFDCAGRKGKLESIDEERLAVLAGIGPDTPVFGVWCAGEIGCAVDSPTIPVGRGWHIMGTLLELPAR